MAGFWGRHRRGAQEPRVFDAGSATRAGSVLLAADERLRIATDELGFGEAELGSEAIQPLARALEAARGHLTEAFRLNRLNSEVTRGTVDEVQARTARILLLCELVEAMLDAQTSALADRIARTRRAPGMIAGLHADIDRQRERIAQARAVLDQLAARYAREALTRIDRHPADAEQLLRFAEHGVGVAERRFTTGQREQADIALAASVDSVRRAATLLDTVETFEVDALRTESELAATAEEARRELADALAEPRRRGLATAIADLRAALADLPPVGVDPDPFTHLARLRQARAALAAAGSSDHERSTHPVPPLRHLRHAILIADRRLDVARDAVAGNPGRIGSAALTRLAESERIRVDLGHSLGIGEDTVNVTDPDHREWALAMASRVAALATECLSLARRDLEAVRGRGAHGLVGAAAGGQRSGD